MIVLNDEQRTKRHNLWLGGSTAGVAGMVNVCAVIAFFAFASNVTGHVAVFAEELVKGHWHQVSVVTAWLLCFIGGAFTGNLLVLGLGSRWHAGGRAASVGLEMVLLVAVGYYGTVHYAETLTETEYLVGILLFTMGLHNGTVATVSKGVVKTTHLTGLSTDLGMELSQVAQGMLRGNDELAFKLKLHGNIFAWYVVGGVGGGMLFMGVGFQAFYAASTVLGLVLAHDMVVMYWAQRAGAGEPSGAGPSPSYSSRNS